MACPAGGAAPQAAGVDVGRTPFASAAAADGDAANPPPAGQGDTLARIHALVGAPSCSADSQCKSLALGARPCGGPETYLAYSSVRTPEDALRPLADIYQAERRAANTQAGHMSTCLMRPEPAAVCQAGMCTLKAPESAQPVAR